MRRRPKQSPLTYQQLKEACDRGKGTEAEIVEQQSPGVDEGSETEADEAHVGQEAKGDG